MLNLKLQDKVQCSELRKRRKITDITENTQKQKMKMGPAFRKNEGPQMDQTLHNKGDKRDQGDDQADDGKRRWQT